jgi:alkylation response protein AidB-like acyl-CoA dehydrogenase
VSPSSAGDQLARRGLGLGLGALRRLAASDVLDRVGMRERFERAVFRGTRGGIRSVTTAGRTFVAARALVQPARQAPAGRADLFDVTPDDEQTLIQEAVREYAAAKVRPAASEADAKLAVPAEIIAQINELGLNMLGVPEALGGATDQQAAVTAVLVDEALAHGDMGIAYGALAAGAVASAIGRWGSGQQQATYLPAFASDEVPASALAILEPVPLFDPLKLQTKARRAGDGWILDGAKALVARAGECELFVIGAEAAGVGPALFVIEARTSGLSVQAEPAMGLRAAKTSRLLLDGVRVSANAILGENDPSQAYVECVQRARIAWCALALGASQAVLDYVVPYVKDRRAFGESIANRQAVAFAVSDVAIESSGMRLATYRAASLADGGKDFDRATAIARTLCSRHGMQIGSQGVQLLGGHGFTKEHPVERWYRDLRAAGVMEGGLLV